MNAQTIEFTADGIKEKVTNLNKANDINVTIFCEGDFNNYAYIDTDGTLEPIAQGSLSTLYRALGTFELAYAIGRKDGSIKAEEKRLSIPNFTSVTFLLDDADRAEIDRLLPMRMSRLK